ncbi:cupredoxin family protein [Pseudomonas sp. RTC3]|uniref:copper-resistant cuproprotein CopI n=1 Tax=Pseudomonas sp. 5C2 TaxID=3048588 RepID=UPI002AB46853|nr:cupredoxin family protein [Pseudomonas sp. 5C2]MDY7565409.1 cupredoxin family protein [Pseudomonas sp. 5C2]MEB0062573.1 cupredoxin family protein [Pseudomonas sp. RTC3]MEB0239968.1 cupredoxin family protein [Pseudomonas sp. 5C2]
MVSLVRIAVIAGLLGLSLPLMASSAHTLSFGHAAPASQATRTVELTLGDMFFEDKTIQVKAGETVRFVLVNKGQLLHEFNLGDAAMRAEHQKEMLAMQQGGMLSPTGMSHEAMDHGSMMQGAMSNDKPMKHDAPNSVLVEPGKTAELTWTFSKASNLEFACNIPGHYQAGMVGKINVVD